MVENGDYLISGKVYDPSTLTFRELDEADRILRDDIHKGDPPPPGEELVRNQLLAAAIVLRQRDDPAFSLEDARDLAPGAILIDADKAKEMNDAARKAGPPTAPKAKRSTLVPAGPPN